VEYGRPLYFRPVVCSSIFFFLFSSPNLSRRRLDARHISTHGVALVLKRAASGSLEIQDAKIANNSPSKHHRTNLSGYIFTIKARIDNRKKSVK